jgi:hypothetical protein
MKQITNDLQKYIQKHFKDVYDINNSSVIFSEMQKKFINDFHDRIIQGHLAWFEQLSAIDDSSIAPTSSRSNYSYIPADFREIIENKMTLHKHYHFSIGSKKISVVFYANAEKSYPMKTWLKYLQKIFIWLHIANQYSSKNCSPILNIYIYLTPTRKKIPESKSVEIGRTHANTAFTTSCTKTTEIHIYREEEWFKVFIHETFHSLGMDFSTMDSSSADMAIKSIYGLNTHLEDVRLYESYSEVWAEFIHTCIFVHFQMIKSNSPQTAKYLGGFDEKVRKHLCYEITFSMIQCVKILQHYDLQVRYICTNSEDSNKNIFKKYKETTPVFSYYVIKSMMLFYINDFIEWAMVHNHGSFDFLKTDGNIDSYVAFIRKHRSGNDYCSQMNMVESLYTSHYRIIHKNNSTGLTTLRMTMLED